MYCGRSVERADRPPAFWQPLHGYEREGKEQEMSAQTLKNRIYTEIEYDGANVSCIDTGEGLVLIDTPLLQKDISHWQGFVAGLNDKDVRYIINTDHHFDHIIGNKQLGGTVIMHEAARAAMLTEGMTLRESMAGMSPGRTQEETDFILSEPLIPAHITFSDEMTLHLGCTFRLIHTPGHTPGTICVHLVEDKVLFTGDNVVVGSHPYKGQGNFGDWLATLKRLEEMPADTIVPGHGEVCDKAGLKQVIRYFEELLTMTKDLLEKGVPREDVVAQVRDGLLGCYEIEPEMKEGAEAIFDEGTRRLCDELRS
jgi:glyoxylase-like metal-dependent hydrolase (beta-lactamase superfamily II)